MATPEVSPIVGMAQVHGDVDSGHQLPEPAFVHPALAYQPLVVEAEALEPAVEVEAWRDWPDEEQHRLGMARAYLGERAQELRDSLARVHDSEAADDRPRRNASRLDLRHRPGGMRHDPDRAPVPRAANEPVHCVRVDDQPGGVLEHEPGERKLLGPGLPEWRDALVEDSVCKEPADHSVLALHRVEVAVAVAAPDRHSRDEVVDDEVVQDDDSRPPAQRIDDPRMRVGVVPHVVERGIRASRSALAPFPARPSRRAARAGRQQERAVVRPRPRSRSRRHAAQK